MASTQPGSSTVRSSMRGLLLSRLCTVLLLGSSFLVSPFAPRKVAAAEPADPAPRAVQAGDTTFRGAKGDTLAAQVAALFRTRCVTCHGPDKDKGGLRLDRSADALGGGYSGPVILPGDSAGSRLIQVVAGIAEDQVRMPPEGEPLTTDDVALLKTWIDAGAVGLTDDLLAAGVETPRQIDHWSFKPLTRTAPPGVRPAGPAGAQAPGWIRNGIDAFVNQKLAERGITPAGEADPHTLVRRVTLDLTGLPPTRQEVEAFLSDTCPDAYERLVDRLLASPHYGERWARPWLDLCHYADTDGYLTDQQRPVAWRYRQWLVDALNRDMPFDQFTIEQLAGDLLPDAGAEQLIATGFLRNTLSNREGGADLEEYRVEQVVDRTMMTGTAWLGLTVGCARCHDHKFDPISQREFFELYAFFDTADEVNFDAPLPGEWDPYSARRPEYERRRAEILAPVAEAVAELQARWESKLLEAVAHPSQDHVWDRQWEVLGLIWGGNFGEGQLEGTQIVFLDPAKRTASQSARLLDYFLAQGSVIDPARFSELKLPEILQQLNQLAAEMPKLTRAPAMRESQIPRATRLHVRGDFRSPGVPVSPGTPDILPPPDETAQPNRLTLARWLVSDKNPLASRTAVNRAWQEFFGRGLVLTAEDFGKQGVAPTHAELLDWLAAEFKNSGWSVKSLHRMIVTSATYRQSARARPELAAVDPYNELLARQSSLRLSAEQIRDATLAASGLLNRRIGGPCVYPPQPETVAMEGFDNKWQVSEGSDRVRRGLYTYIQRLSPFAQNVTFDAPALSRACTRRERSNTPLQALTLLNDPAFFEAARNLAGGVLSGGRVKSGIAECIDALYWRCLSRPPTVDETARLAAYYGQQLEILVHDPQAAAEIFPGDVSGTDRVEAAAWTLVASVVLNLHEFITRE